MNKKFITGLLFAGLIICSCGNSNENSNTTNDSIEEKEASSNTKNETKKKNSKEKISFVTLEKSSSNCIIRIELMEVDFGDEKINKKINEGIISQIAGKESITSYMESVINDCPDGDIQWSYEIKCQAEGNTSSLLSVKIIQEIVGMTMIQNSNTVIFDKNTGELVNGLSLIKKENHTQVTQLLQKELSKWEITNGYEGMCDINDLTLKSVSNNYTISNEGITFYCDMICASVVGIPEIFLSFKTLKPYMNDLSIIK